AAHYSSAKAGVIGFTKSLGKELAKTGVLANCVTPAVIETDIFQQMTAEHVQYMLSRIPMGRFGQKEEAAALVAWLCSRECSFSTGAVFDLSGGRRTAGPPNPRRLRVERSSAVTGPRRRPRPTPRPTPGRCCPTRRTRAGSSAPAWCRPRAARRRRPRRSGEPSSRTRRASEED